MEIRKSSAKGEVHSNTSSPEESRQKSNKSLKFTSKTTRKKKILRTLELVEGNKS